MPIPSPNFNPPFNIVRANHIILRVRDVVRSRAFYEEIIGLHVSYADATTVCLRGMEERNHHSILLMQTDGEPCCEQLGFKVASEKDLDLARRYFDGLGLSTTDAVSPFLGPALRVSDATGVPLEFVCGVEQAPRILQKYGLYRGVHPLRIDHFNCFSNNVQESVDSYNALGFRLTEYTATDDDKDIWAAWMHRKGGVHDIAFTNGVGPRLHHVALWVPTPMHIIHLCDVMATTGYLDNLERGPGRHGISNAFFLYIRDPDGHRVEIYASDYLTVDPDLQPIRWSLTDTSRQTLWGTPAPKSWFEEGSMFKDVAVSEPALKAQPIVAH